MATDYMTQSMLIVAVFCSSLIADSVDNFFPDTATVYVNLTRETRASTPHVGQRLKEIQTTSRHYKLRHADVTSILTALSRTDAVTSSMTSDAPAVSERRQEYSGRYATGSRLLQFPDPGERRHQGFRPQHGRTLTEERWKQELNRTKSASAVIVIAGLFCTLTVMSTLALAVFCRKRNTVFALQKCEQMDYFTATAAAADDFDDELSTDCDSTTLPTIVTEPEVDRLRALQRRSDYRDSGVTPSTPDLSLFCVGNGRCSGKRKRTGSDGEATRDRRAAAELTTPVMTSSNTFPVECTDDDSDDSVEYRDRRDVMSASSLIRCDNTSTSGLDFGATRFQRSSSLGADVCRFAMTCSSAASQPVTLWKNSAIPSPVELGDWRQQVASCSPMYTSCHVVATETEHETSTLELSVLMQDDISNDDHNESIKL